MARYKKRVELINILKTSVHLNNTGASEAEGWSAYLKNYNIQRFGAWCYKNGRVYYYIGGSNPMCHDIKIHANRNNTLGGIFQAQKGAVRRVWVSAEVKGFEVFVFLLRSPLSDGSKYLWDIYSKLSVASGTEMVLRYDECPLQNSLHSSQNYINRL